MSVHGNGGVQPRSYDRRPASTDFWSLGGEVRFNNTPPR